MLYLHKAVGGCEKKFVLSEECDLKRKLKWLQAGNKKHERKPEQREMNRPTERNNRWLCKCEQTPSVDHHELPCSPPQNLFNNVQQGKKTKPCVLFYFSTLKCKNKVIINKSSLFKELDFSSLVTDDEIYGLNM